MIKRKTSGKKATKKKVTKTTLKKSLKTLHLRLPQFMTGRTGRI